MGILIVCMLAFVLAVACVIIHYEAFRLAAGLTRNAEVPRRGRLLLVILGAMVAHLLEIGCYSIVFWLCHGHPLLGVIEGKLEGNLFDFIYFSMTNYTTLGVGDVVAHGPLRLLATAEALTGLVLLSWTASFTYLSMENFWRRENSGRTQERAGPVAVWSYSMQTELAKEMAMQNRVERYDKPPKSDEEEALRLAEATDISPDQARELIRRHGNDHAKLMEIARTMKAES
jgi:Ion channel